MLVDRETTRKHEERGVALMKAIRNRDVPGVRSALAAGAFPGMAVQGNLPLLEAVETGVVELVVALIEAGAALEVTVERFGRRGPTALVRAIELRHEDVALALVRAGAPLDARVGDWSVVDAAVAFALPRLTAALAERGLTPSADETLSLGMAAALGRVSRVTTLLPGTSLDTRCKALELATQGAHLAVVDLLLGSGLEAAHAQRALGFAIQNDDLRVLERLLAAGASATAPTGLTARSPLMMAAMCGSVAVVARLLAAGANPTERSDGSTPLEVAHPEVKALLNEAAQAAMGKAPRDDAR